MKLFSLRLFSMSSITVDVPFFRRSLYRLSPPTCTGPVMPCGEGPWSADGGHQVPQGAAYTIPSALLGGKIKIEYCIEKFVI